MGQRYGTMRRLLHIIIQRRNHKKNEHIAELSIGNSLIGIHGGGEGKEPGQE